MCCINARQILRRTAPELMDGAKASKAADVYAYGVVCWEMITGKFPFAELTTFQVIKALSGGERPEIPKGTNPKFASLIETCWLQDPDKRFVIFIFSLFFFSFLFFFVSNIFKSMKAKLPRCSFNL